jgi:signal transduction histidine kinase
MQTLDKKHETVLNEFIALASHQLRSPLITIKWTLEMLDEGDAGDLNSKQRTYIRQLIKANNQMVTLVTGLLNISRIEAGRLIIEPVSTNTSSLLTDILEQLNSPLKRKNQSFAVYMEPNLPEINVDPTLVRQAFYNLIANAIKYSPPNVSIGVTLKKTESALQLSVIDHGCGIPESAKDRIFNKFFRAPNAVKYEADGSGLGLYLAKLVIEASNGKIWFESKENEGTTFFVNLPLSGSIAKTGDVKLTS